MDIQSVLNVETNALAVVYFRAFNRLIFPFSLSHHIGKSPFSISTYMEEVLQQIFSLSIWKGRCDVSPFYWGLERNYWGLRKNKGEREIKNQSAGVCFFNINPLY